MALREAEYKQNICFLKSLGYGNSKYLKLVYMRNVKNSGLDIPKKELKKQKKKKSDSRGIRLEESISRSKRTIFEYAFCNEWEYFFTGTINEKKHERFNIEKYHDDLTKWVRNLNRIHQCNIRYIFVPELHKDGAVHVHGFLSGIPEKMIHRFMIGERMGKRIVEKVRRGECVYNWIKYSEKFGFCSLEPIRNEEAAAKYIEKYITKELVLAVSEGKQCFWHSRGLKKAVLIAKGELNCKVPFEWDYCGEYSSVKMFEDTCEIRDSIIGMLV